MIILRIYDQLTNILISQFSLSIQLFNCVSVIGELITIVEDYCHLGEVEQMTYVDYFLISYTILFADFISS